MNTFKVKFWAWYDEQIAAGWYRSSSLIVGWLTSAAVFSPEIVQFVFDHWDILGGMVLPKLDGDTKALILGLYLAFVAPPLRAWRQKKMQEIALKQAVKTGAVTSGVDTDQIDINVGKGTP
ncbi:hypothetical protein SAMN05518669_103337 [Variovorax sp. YR634]|uniref:hypothetical protein n=1 Tax=Variovorax sp. YR634 TaxID=1884385 RepID=UPI00089728F3|nr:hypothetical protein [Variovorax sp. YR634]SDX12049.1 hypothetical protein SAMN05518669_103337 [Variovorax sp. YR634]